MPSQVYDKFEILPFILASDSAIRCCSGAIANSSSAYLNRGVVYFEQFQSNEMSSLKNSRFTIGWSSGSARMDGKRPNTVGYADHRPT